jgi:glycerate kinase
MRVLIAPDSFGGTLSALEAAAAVSDGWARVRPDDELTSRPLSDGGPGFVDVLNSTLRGSLLRVTVTDPLGRDADGEVLIVGSRAFVESAQSTGLHLLAPSERDPKRTTSFGVGQLIAAAVEAGARTIVVGLGGSGTNDGGAGMLAALGFVARDAGGRPLPYGGSALLAVDHCDGVAQLRGAQLVIASDVDNPLTGPQGASAVFGPQKGATADDVALLDAALAQWGSVLQRDAPDAPPGLAECPGSGAAGGLGAGLFALGARREAGIDVVSEALDLPSAVRAADLVLTGEGRFDRQSLRGKVAIGVAAMAAAAGVPCVVLAGQVSVDPDEALAFGVTSAHSVAEHAGSVEAAMAEPAARLADLAEHVAREQVG